ncbi:hypothetical protein HYH03_017802 [Edaphochlamys debaryana]|uniref:Uncharacterized protein n=1 Tax=Edaphochlamys debaryana TaxID=47281 RepID=A0A836BQ35_9CHLO|nr:hypothetical protein HYH03_017802 [Edaphochlamys debaryana]|eukprot:KAG2483354.1 hypothetical protein HYH03_017802 [Edaphochlamys debaryana]
MELATSAFRAVCVGLMSYRHASAVAPDDPWFTAKMLAARLVSGAMTVYIAWALGARAARQRGGAGSARLRGGKGGEAEAGGQGVDGEPMEAEPGPTGSSDGAAGGGVEAACAPESPADVNGDDAAPAPAPNVPTRQPLESPFAYAKVQPKAAEHCPGGGSAIGSATNTSGGAGAAVEAMEALLPWLRPPRPRLVEYRSAAVRHTIRLKIPDAQPEDLPPGHRERLRALLAERGLVPGAVAVQRGCIRLTMLALGLRRPQPRPVGTNSGSAASEAEGPDAPRGSGSGLEPAAVVQALGLPTPAGYAGGRQDWVAGVTYEASELLCEEGRSLGQGPLASARVLRMSPRVLLVPPQRQRQRQQQPDGGCWEAPELRVVLSVPRLRAACGDGVNAPPVLSAHVFWDGVAQPASVSCVPCAASGSGLPAAATSAAAASGAAGAGEQEQVWEQGLALKEEGCAGAELEAGEVEEDEVEYAIRLPDQAPPPGVVLLELSLEPSPPEPPTAGAPPAPALGTLGLVLPLLATHDPAAAAEVGALAGRWPQGAREGRALGELLLDLGLWAAGPPAVGGPAGGKAAEEEEEEGADGGEEGGEAGPLQLALWRASVESALGLLVHAGCPATAARIRADLQTLATITAAIAAASAAVSGPAASPSRGRLRCWLGAAAWVVRAEAGLWGGAAGPGGPGRPSAAEVAAFRGRGERWGVSLSPYLWALEVAAMAMVLIRDRDNAAPDVPLYVSLLLLPGLLSAGARLALPRPRWQAVTRAVRGPRMLLYAAVRACRGRPMPPGLAAQVPLMFLSGSFVLPLASLVPLRSMALVSTLRLPLNIHFLASSGAASSAPAAVLLAAAVEALALAVTLACHTHLRLEQLQEQAPSRRGARPSSPAGGSQPGGSGKGCKAGKEE